MLKVRRSLENKHVNIRQKQVAAEFNLLDFHLEIQHGK